MLRKVLLVDDSPLVRELCRTVLRGTVREIVPAGSGCEALDALQDHPDTDAVVLDLHLPVMNGLSVLAAMRESDRHRELPVVLLSLSGDEALVMRGISLGATGSVRKFENLHALPRMLGTIAPRPAGPEC